MDRASSNNLSVFVPSKMHLTSNERIKVRPLAGKDAKYLQPYFEVTSINGVFE